MLPPEKYLRLLPLVSASVSFSLLVLRVISLPAQKLSPSTRTPATGTRFHRLISGNGGRAIYSFMILRLLGSLGLLALSITMPESQPKDMENVLVSLTIRTSFATFLYTSVLAVLAITVSPPWGQSLSRHLCAILFVSFAVDFCINVFPMLVYPSLSIEFQPRTIILFFTAVVIPLVSPRPYCPVVPDKVSVPTPEQTASILSLATYSYLDPLMFLAYRSKNITKEQLPPLADNDSAHYLKKKNFPHIDPFLRTKRRHVFFGLMRIFRADYMVLVIMLLVKVFSTFVSPIAMNRLLHYIESQGYLQGAAIRPSFWILALFLGPTINSLATQWYEFVGTRALVRAENVLTQLCFEHALRTRISTDEVDQEANAKAQDEDSNRLGKMNNLISTDLANITEARYFLLTALDIPLQITLCIGFLYVVLGWSALVGLAGLLLMFPIPAMMGKRLQAVQQQVMKKTDARVQTVVETLNLLRMIKLFGWSERTKEKISEKRNEELAWVWKRKILHLTTNCINFMIPLLAMMLPTFAVYTLVMKQELNASKVFSSLTVFDMVRLQLHIILQDITKAIKGKVSLDRMNEFLNDTPLLDHYSVNSVEADNSDIIGFREATFSWSTPSINGTSTPSSRQFNLRIEGELVFQRNTINLIIGPTGSGKTSMLMALLGEMHFIPSGPESYHNLPRNGGVAYAAQTSWISNASIKENIKFLSPFDQARYSKVLYQCGLEPDLALFEAGDLTELGEKGITLSGGQKARISLARACYSQADIILLDDVLAALDVHTAKWVVEKCLQGDLMKGRTIILVSHHVALTLPIAGFVVSLGSDGRVVSQGPVEKTLADDRSLEAQLLSDKQALEKLEEVVHEPKEPAVVSGKIIVEEEVAEGKVGWPAIQLYLSALGGRHPFIFYLVFLTTLAFTDVAIHVQIYYLGRWAKAYDVLPANEVPVFHYLAMSTLILVFTILGHGICFATYTLGGLRASRTIHKALINSVMGATLRWIETTPQSRVVTRGTQDIEAIDSDINDQIWILIDILFYGTVKFALVLAVAPAAFLPSFILGALGYWFSSIYLAAQLPVKRAFSLSKSPVIGHFQATVSALSSIRAFSAQEWSISESLDRLDCYTQTGRAYHSLGRWIGLRLDGMGAVFSSFLAIYLVYFKSADASTIGFGLNMAVGLNEVLLWLVQYLNQFEVSSDSLERIQQYLGIDQELSPNVSPPAYWPASGELRIENMSARYSVNGPQVLQDISVTIKSGEKVGIVGRTGSGKSSLTLSLLRGILTQGQMYYDGIETSTISLEKLRSSIALIPQAPELLAGTLRENLDPFSMYDDAVLNNALRSSGLFSLQEGEERRMTLDSVIATGGSSLSLGECQIIALARAIVKLQGQSRILILDEATSAIDYKTDALIQSVLRNELQGITVITVAHRLQTVMESDKIIVMDAGRIAEIGTPQELLKAKGKLAALVEESKDKDELIALAK
ncbi:P-loop containing nucleoside triphosphate hydrolase protein [Mycena floridula]|nr:P-loop containing nucleoside triphosphate hydrolase protein [Mycena floridula]